MAKDDAPAQGRWSGFGVIAGTELSLADCTVTIEGDEVVSAALVAQAPSSVRDRRERLTAERAAGCRARLPPACC